MEKPYAMAETLTSHENIGGVRVDHNRMVVTHAPNDKHVEQIPEDVYEKIQEVIEDTEWVPEYTDAGRNAEHHEFGHGRCDCILRPSEQPAGYELQFRLTKPHF